PPFPDYIPSSAVGSRALPSSREGNSYHHRTSSEILLIDEPPSWLDELLDEPDTPVRRGHRRSSSDSFAYFDACAADDGKYVAQDDITFRDITPLPLWGCQDFGIRQHAQQRSPLIGKNKNKLWDRPVNSSIAAPPHADTNRSTLVDNHRDQVESAPRDQAESSLLASATQESDTRRAKQQYAQRSRVRKLQYIAELERNVQALQAEGSQVSAELGFLNQQNLILSMENKALKQRLESMSQQHLIKCLEHEILEREAARLRSLYQLQIQQQQQATTPPSSGHGRTKSRDLDRQMADLSLKNKE
ncbi:hypothetical protein M569_01765, partial [Genlisea aurea]